MSAPRLIASFAAAEEFLAAFDQQIAHGGLLVRGATLPAAAALSPCTVEVRIAGGEGAEAQAQLASAAPGLGVTVLFPERPAALHALAARLRAPAPLSLPERMKLAQTCDREQRFALLRDPNQQLHALVLRNPRIGLDEVQWAARLTSLSPEALKAIADHPEWGQNPAIATALVKNPKTPVPVALKLLPRLPAAEVRALAKSQGKPQLVQAAKKQVVR